MNLHTLSPLTLSAATLYAPSENVREHVLHISRLTGIDVQICTEKTQAEAGLLRLVEKESRPVKIQASFHPHYSKYYSSGFVDIALPSQAEDLCELLIAAGAAMRGRSIAIVGINGGVGASTLALWLARISGQDKKEKAAGECTIAYADFSDTGLALEYLAARENDDLTGARWADIAYDESSLIPSRLARSLPEWKGVHILSGDERGGLDGHVERGEKALCALAQSHRLCWIDIPARALQTENPLHQWLLWCDDVLIVMGTSAYHVRSAQIVLERLRSWTNPTIVINGVKSGQHAAHIAQMTGVEKFLPVRRLSGMDSDHEHGGHVGDRARSATARDMRKIYEHVCQKA